MQTQVHDLHLHTNEAWLLKLRWAAAVGQLITVAVVAFVFRVLVPWWPLAALIATTAVTNVLLTAWFYRSASQDEDPHSARSHRVLGLVMLFDLLMLTAMLYFAGGSSNPFCVFYFVNISLAAILLPGLWAWLVAGLAACCFALISIVYQPIIELEPQQLLMDRTLARGGWLAAFTTCAFLLLYFMSRLSSEIQESERILSAIQRQQAINEKFQSLGTLSAGAAHELASPLSTIAIASSELEQQLRQGDTLDAQAVADVQLIRSQVDRCRHILDRLSADAGEETGHVGIGTLIDSILEDLPAANQIHLTMADGVTLRSIRCGLITLAQAIRGVLQNAIDASPDGHPVQLELREEEGQVRLTVRDCGHGIPTDAQDLVFDPFFTPSRRAAGWDWGCSLPRPLSNAIGDSLQLVAERVTAPS